MQPHNVWIEIDIRQLRSNLDKIKSLIAPSVKVMAIVKANAYGHGMVDVARSLTERVDFFGVSCFAEGERLRQEGIMTPVLVLGTIMPNEFDAAIHHGLSLAVSDLSYVGALNDAGRRLGRRVKVHAKIDTGMGRWGFAYRDAFNEVAYINKLPFVDVEGIFTHFPVADNKNSDYTERQIELFNELLDTLEKNSLTIPYRHAANSGGILHFKDSHFNLVRPGIMMYGYYPNDRLPDSLGLIPVLSVHSRVGLVKEFGPKRGISYGRTYLTARKTKIIVVPIGYSHGYPYALSQKSSVLIKGKRYPIAGSVCMDYMMVDVGDDTIETGDEVIILGAQGDERITAYELAKKAGTIAYEIITGLGAHVPRVYIE